MPVLKPAILTVAVLSLALSPQVFAKTIFASGDWSLDDSQPGVQGKGNCVAATATYLGNNGAFSLNVVLDKSGTHPVELLIRPFRAPSKVPGFQVTIEPGRTYTFVKLPASIKGEETFWNLPRDTGKFVAQLKTSSQLTVDAGSGMGVLPFSMTGATAVLTQLEKRCVANPALSSSDFEKAFLSPEMVTVDFSKIDQIKASSLRDIITKGVEAFHNIDKMKAALDALETNYAKLNQEQATLIAAIDQLSNRDIPSFGASRIASQAAIDKANADIATLTSAIAAQESLLVSAQAAFDQATATIKPILPEQQRLLALKQKDESRQASAEAELATTGQSVANKALELADSKAESENLRGKISRAVEETKSARARLVEAEKALKGFDPSNEIRRRQDSDRRLGGLDSEIKKLFKAVRSGEQAIAAAEADRKARDQAVHTCQAGKGTPDCTVQLSELTQSEQRLSGARQNIAQSQSSLQAKNIERDSLSRQIEQEVNSQHEEILSREAESRHKVTDIEKLRDQMDTRVRDLNQYVIPGLQNELTGLQAKRAANSSDLESARKIVASSSEAYRRYKASVNFDALNAEVEKTAARVAAIKQEISNLNGNVKDRQQIVSNQTAQRDSSDKQIVVANDTIKQKTARRSEVNQLLVLYAADRKAADDNIAAAKQVLAAISHEFATQLPQVAKR